MLGALTGNHFSRPCPLDSSLVWLRPLSDNKNAPPECAAGDIDIFLCVEEDKAEATLRRIYEAVQRNQRSATKRKLLVTRSKNCVTFFRVAGAMAARTPVQVIPNVTESVLGLLLDFDVDR